MNPIHVIYHGNCMDGFSAAWVVRKWHTEKSEGKLRQVDGVTNFFLTEITFEAAQYQQTFDQNFYERYIDKQLIIVDFSFPPEVMLKMLDYCDNIVWIDHHKSAVEAVLACEPLVKHPLFAKFHSMDHSGAMLTWQYFFGSEVPPQLLWHVEDRDLWKFKLEGTRKICAAVFSYDYDFGVYDKLMYSTAMYDLSLEGSAIERKHFKDIHENLNTSVRWMRIGDVDMPVINCPKEWGSDAANILAQTSASGMAGYYWDSASGRNFGLRSVGDADVSKVAKIYGGGGHKNAAGFKLHPGYTLEFFDAESPQVNAWSSYLAAEHDITHPSKIIKVDASDV
jgi:oligoribonuclease NrnB/cAMP/cGMP phosphodiesterase (DHH superfamily)